MSRTGQDGPYVRGGSGEENPFPKLYEWGGEDHSVGQTGVGSSVELTVL